MTLKSLKYSFIAIICSLCSCKNEGESTSESEGSPLFTLLSNEQTNLSFQNNLEEGPNTNILMYEYFYNGAGVSTADYNNDGLLDVYFVSNMGENKLYLNRGKMRFEDYTIESGAGGRPGPWKTGVTSVDINADGKMDIYLSYSGSLPAEKRVNQLFINKGNDASGTPVFEEKAAEYGLDHAGYCNQAYFFDYDKDGDLDALMLNHNPKNLPLLNETGTAAMLKVNSPEMGLRFYKNNGGKFQDQTQASKISGSELSYGLGLGISDLNNDGWPDFYVSNDYSVPDYLYINNKNGTFTNQLSTSMGHTSQFSMGNDIADINNDGHNDVFTLDMLPEDNARQKLLLAPDNFAKFEQNVRSGFYYQYMRNMLHLNNGNGTFSEIGQLAGVSNTDWSWSALLADYDNDGWKDLFVSNGYLRDYTNLDFIKYMENYVAMKGRLQREDVLEIIKQMPASNVSNYIFKNKGDLTFKNQTKNWGLERASNSNGSVYADFDNDGDLDLLINNINQPVFLYQNEANKTANYLKINLKGSQQNTLGIGATVQVFVNGKVQQSEQYLSRGYLSSVSPILHFGLGKANEVDSIVVTWNSGLSQKIGKTKANQTFTLNETDAKLKINRFEKTSSPIFKDASSGIDFVHQIENMNDFERQLLLPIQLSYSGPCMTKGDLNADGLEDIAIGGGKNQATSLYFQQKGGKFQKQKLAIFEKDKAFNDGDIVIFDANNDRKNDILIVSGGYHQLTENDSLLQDRLYLNQGNNTFAGAAFPKLSGSKSCVRANDINKDGFLDLFVGTRFTPGKYPQSPGSYLLINNKKGGFTDQTKAYSPELANIGMITDAVWVDLNADKTNELLLVGEFVPLTVLQLKGKTFENTTKEYLDQKYSGWWNKIAIGDFNQDQKPDILIGNMGLNTQFGASKDQPVEMYAKDFDKNGSVDPILCYYIQGKSYPFVTRDELLNQLSYLKPNYTNYESFSKVIMTEIFKNDELNDAQHLEANHMATTLFLSGKDGKYQMGNLPIQAQYSSVNSISIADYNQDGHQDLLLMGNNSYAKLRLGKFDANYGTLLQGNGKGGFTYISQTLSGLKIWGDVRSSLMFDNKVLFGVNGGKVVGVGW
jgi:hypothetical protein